MEPDEVINVAVRLLENKFPKAFSKGRAIRPRVNVNDFKTCLIEENIVKNFELNEHQLYDAVCKLNDDISRIPETEIVARIARENKGEQVIVRNCRVKCETGDFLYLGLFKKTDDWINDLVTNLSK